MNSYELLACIDFIYCYLLLGEFYDGGNADQKGEYFWLFMLLISTFISFPCMLFHKFPSILETVRQMLGLQEEQVIEISGDHPKYEVQ